MEMWVTDALKTVHTLLGLFVPPIERSSWVIVECWETKEVNPLDTVEGKGGKETKGKVQWPDTMLLLLLLTRE